MIWYTPFCVSYLILGQIHTKFPASVIVAYFLTAPFCCDDGMFLECMIISEFHLIKVILFTVVSHQTWIQNKVRRLECCCTAGAMVISLITLHVKCSRFGSPKNRFQRFRSACRRFRLTSASWFHVGSKSQAANTNWNWSFQLFNCNMLGQQKRVYFLCGWSSMQDTPTCSIQLILGWIQGKPINKNQSKPKIHNIGRYEIPQKQFQPGNVVYPCSLVNTCFGSDAPVRQMTAPWLRKII